MDVVMNNIPLVCTLIGAVGVLFAIILAGIVKGAPAGDEKVRGIAGSEEELLGVNPAGDKQASSNHVTPVPRGDREVAPGIPLGGTDGTGPRRGR